MKVITSNYSITQALVEHVKESFPNRLPTEFINPQQLAFLQGQQSVIHYLERLLEEALEEN